MKMSLKHQLSLFHTKTLSNKIRNSFYLNINQICLLIVSSKRLKGWKFFLSLLRSRWIYWKSRLSKIYGWFGFKKSRASLNSLTICRISINIKISRKYSQILFFVILSSRQRKKKIRQLSWPNLLKIKRSSTVLSFLSLT